MLPSQKIKFWMENRKTFLSQNKIAHLPTPLPQWVLLFENKHFIQDRPPENFMAQRGAMVESQSLMWWTTVQIPTRGRIPAVVAFPPADPGSIEAISRPLLSWKVTIGHFQTEKWPLRGAPAQVEPFSVHFSLQKWQMVTFEERSGMLIEIVHFEQIKALPRI